MSLSEDLLQYNTRLQSLHKRYGDRLVEALRKVTQENNGNVYDLGHISFFNPLPGEPYLYLEIRYYQSREFHVIGVNRKHMYGLMKVFRPLTENEEFDQEKLRQLVSMIIQRITHGLQRLGIEEDNKLR